MEGLHTPAADPGDPDVSTDVRLMNISAEEVTISVPPTITDVLGLRRFLLKRPDLTAPLSLKAANPVSLTLLRIHEDDELGLQDGDAWPLPSLDEGDETDGILLRIFIRSDFPYLVLTAVQKCKWLRRSGASVSDKEMADISHHISNGGRDMREFLALLRSFDMDGRLWAAIQRMGVPFSHLADALASYLASRPRLGAGELFDVVDFTKDFFYDQGDVLYGKAVLGRATVDLLLRQEPADVAECLRTLNRTEPEHHCRNNEAPVLYHFLRWRQRGEKYRMGRLSIGVAEFSLLRYLLEALPIPGEVLEFTNTRDDTMLLAILDYDPRYLFDDVDGKDEAAVCKLLVEKMSFPQLCMENDNERTALSAAAVLGSYSRAPRDIAARGGNEADYENPFYDVFFYTKNKMKTLIEQLEPRLGARPCADSVAARRLLADLHRLASQHWRENAGEDGAVVLQRDILVGVREVIQQLENKLLEF